MQHSLGAPWKGSPNAIGWRCSCGRKDWITSRSPPRSIYPRVPSAPRSPGRGVDLQPCTTSFSGRRKEGARMAGFDRSQARSEHPSEGEIHAWLDGALSPEDAALLEA